MRGHVESEYEVAVSADEIWAVYSSPDLPRLIVELMPTRYQKIDVLEGDGTEGTIIRNYLVPTNPPPLTWNEKFMKIDNKTRTKVVRHIEGGWLDMGFTLYENIFTVIKKDENSCIITQRTVFDVTEEFESNVSLISSSWAMARAISNYVIQNRVNKDDNRKGATRCGCF
ncbi:S-norcoclaurine synthase [Thalictrum thalictroides]|uniref:S-norcoclaurine synthase n=1 Tax=Thalictrum thalictroides TaxID=46969 RepID=A0A7J6VNH1_THATH|nr:S-norcoclaurine synthase [Thalictrum thalictroides]